MSFLFLYKSLIIVLFGGIFLLIFFPRNFRKEILKLCLFICFVALLCSLMLFYGFSQPVDGVVGVSFPSLVLELL